MAATLTDRTYAVAWDDGTELEAAGIPGGPLRARLQLDTRNGRRLMRWNGFVAPHFERSEIERYIAFVESQGPDTDYDRAAFDGDTLVVTDPYYMHDAANGGPEYVPDRMDPTELGLYPLGAFGWTWCIWPDADADEFGDLPQDVCDDLGLDGRDGKGVYRWADL